MRKTTCLVAAILTTAAFWTYAEISFSPGVGLGLNLATVSGTDSTGKAIDDAPEITLESKMTYLGGAFVDLGITEMLSVEPGIGIVSRGGKVKVSALGFSLTATLSSLYLDLPVLVKAKFKAGPAVPFVALGPNLGILISAKSRAMGTELDLKDSTQVLDLGINFGAGSEFDLSSLQALENVVPFIKAGYQLGLSNNLKDPSEKEAMKNNAIFVLAGARFKMM